MSRRARSKHVTGLEIEPGSIAAAKVTVNGHVVVDDAAVASLEPNVVRDGEVGDAAALTEALKALFRERKDFDKKVRVGIANARIVVRPLDLPPMTDAKELAAAVRFQAAEELPMPLEQAVLDYQDMGVIDTPDGPRQRVVVVAARREMVESIAGAVRAAGLKIEGLDLSAFAMIRALGPDAEPTLYLSVGGLTNLAIADDRGCSFTRVAPTGLESMAAEIAERVAMPLAEARDWLARVGLLGAPEKFEGDAEVAAMVRTVLDSGVRKLSSDLRFSLDFHQSAGGAPVERVVLTGPATRIPNFAAGLERELGIAVEERTVDVSEAALGIDAARVTLAAGLAVEEVPS
jgi:type IV pilus assembly protein PilM